MSEPIKIRRFQVYNHSKTFPKPKYKHEGEMYDSWEWSIYHLPINISASLDDCLTLNTYLAVSAPIKFNIHVLGDKRSYKSSRTIIEFIPRTLVGNTTFKVEFRYTSSEEQYEDFLGYCKAHGIRTW